MNRCFKDLAKFVKLHDGFGKPRLDFQQMYKLFPDFEFKALPNFGKYENWGEAYEHKDYPMEVTCTDEKGRVQTAYMTYKEYTDRPRTADEIGENLAYVG